jgi:hypothetical protein
MIASHSPSIKAGSAIIGLTARYDASRCPPFKRLLAGHLVRHEALEAKRDAHAVSRERTPE